MKRRRVWIGSMSLLMVTLAGCAKPGTERMIYATQPPPDLDAPRTGGSASQATWNFDEESAGGLPTGWRVAETRSAGKPAVWSVAADPTAPGRPNVLAVTETGNSGGTYNLALIEGTSFKDLDLSVRVKAVKGSEDRGGGPVWRCRDGDNYYICRWNPLETNFRVYKVVGGKRRQLASADLDADAGGWHAIRVVMHGRRIECWFDGRKFLEASDDALPEGGMIGLWTKADAATAFDDVSVGPSR